MEKQIELNWEETRIMKLCPPNMGDYKEAVKFMALQLFKVAAAWKLTNWMMFVAASSWLECCLLVSDS
jgi:hypothetical protein